MSGATGAAATANFKNEDIKFSNLKSLTLDKKLGGKFYINCGGIRILYSDVHHPPSSDEVLTSTINYNKITFEEFILMVTAQMKAILVRSKRNAEGPITIRFEDLSRVLSAVVNQRPFPSNKPGSKYSLFELKKLMSIKNSDPGAVIFSRREILLSSSMTTQNYGDLSSTKVWNIVKEEYDDSHSLSNGDQVHGFRDGQVWALNEYLVRELAEFIIQNRDAFDWVMGTQDDVPDCLNEFLTRAYDAFMRFHRKFVMNVVAECLTTEFAVVDPRAMTYFIHKVGPSFIWELKLRNPQEL